MGLFDKGMFLNGDSKGYILINDKTKEFKLKGTIIAHKYSDLISYELQENGHTITKGGIGVGRAIVGGALLGGVGAVLGGLSKSKKHEEIVTKMEIKVTVKNALKNAYYVEIFNKKKIVKGSKDYEKFIKQAESALSALDTISNEQQPTSTPSDLNTQLRELKSLLDDGILTQDEFDRKKTELLG